MTALAPSTTPIVPPAPARLTPLGASMADLTLNMALIAGASPERITEARIGVARSRYLRGLTDLEGFEAELDQVLSS